MRPDVDLVIMTIEKMKFRVLFFLNLLMVNAYAQENIPVGTWRTHFNYNRALALEKAQEKIYCLTEQGLFYFDTQENSTTKLSKVDGLSDTDITAIAYSEQLNLLGLGYENGNIDLIFPDEIFNIATIKNSSITDNKRINNIAYNRQKVYLSTDFGVLVLNPETGQIDETFENLGENGTSLRIEQVLFVDDNIYLATSNGVLLASTDSQLNLQDFNNWTRFEGSIVNGESISSLSAVNGNVYAASSSDVFEFSNSLWTNIAFNTSGESIITLKNTANELLVITESNIRSRSSDGSISFFTLETEANPRDILVETDQNFWYADFGKGLSKSVTGNIERIVPNGVFASDISKLEFVNGAILAFPGSAISVTQPKNNGLGYAQFSGGIWTNVGPEDLLNSDDISDAVALSEENLILSSFGHGIIDLAEDVLYDETNSPLLNNNQSGRNVLVNALEKDLDGNVWVAQIGSNSLLKFAPDKSWQSFTLGISVGQSPLNIKIDDLGQIWMIPTSNFSGMIGYNPETETARYFTASNGGLPNSDVIDLEIDRRGQVWIGTEGGLAFLPFTFGAIDDNSLEVIQPIFGNRILFQDDKIDAIEVDPGNRKWIATSEGLWLFEDDGDELVHNFNTENSPLPSNTITDIKANAETGEVFIATDKGLISFRSDAVNSNTFHQNVKIFPNPVHPGFTGLVGISGLATDVNLKITDVSGKLVREINAAGGGASWDVADYNGVRAQTGIYLIFSSNDDGTETFVGKVAVVN